ncbi:MAG: heme-binding domain-containing protein [Ginsengibacter sp.]
MSRIKKIGLIVLVVIIVIQFIQPNRNESGKALPSDISKVYNVPAPVYSVLKNACYDCHSNNTNYPWYSNIQPFGWWLASHIKRGKEELNFSEFDNYSTRRQRSKLFSVEKSIEDGTMPLPSYALIHKDSRLTKEQKGIIIDWADKIKDSLNKAD